MPPNPHDSFEDKARHLRRLYRQNGGECSRDLVRAEYRRLFGEGRPRDEFAQILTSAWTEARELAGWFYDMGVQAWLRADGSRVRYDDGSEWRHL
jgi:hypothetical protein